MAHFWINKGVPGAREKKVTAESYGVEGDYVHFYNGAKLKVLSIRKESAFLIERDES
ncbi:hypothetical protein ACFCXC_18555 [Streptomyces microflavus]|uniref:hypothetical protein n=1 Tax=Streptomyces microflavus TaxID=1919 RepID=UPI0035D928D4